MNNIYFKKIAVFSLIIGGTLVSLKSKGEIIKPDNHNEDRIAFNYKQRHSHLTSNLNVDDLYADAIKIKKNLTFAEAEDSKHDFSFDSYEIPSNDLYQGAWNTESIHSYGGLQLKKDVYKVDMSNFVMPIAHGHTTSKFGFRGRRMHYGIDLKVQVGDTIYAAFDGKVRIKKYEKKGFGKYLVIRHPNGLETVYGHLSDYIVGVNDVVKAGQPIALGGNTGRSTGSHLHFEMRYIGIPLNPSDLVDFDNFVCRNDEYVITPDKLKNNTRGAGTAAKGGNTQMKFHTIRKGETLSAIAKRYNIPLSSIFKMNRMTAQTKLKIGSKVRIS